MSKDSELIAQLRASRAVRQSSKTNRKINGHNADFNNLSEYNRLRLQRGAAELMKIEPPFYRTAKVTGPARIKIGTSEMIQFANYDYLGLNRDERVLAAAAESARIHGLSATASRLAGGQRLPHLELEAGLAAIYGSEDAITFVSGYATNVSVIGTLCGPKDLVLIDELSHNSISEGVRLSGSARLSIPHNDWAWMDRKLASVRDDYRRVLIVIEGLYSMDGDMPDLNKFIEVKDRYGAWLMVDEAHALGVAGATGSGSAEAQDVDPSRVDIWMGTLSKSLCACGGYIAGQAALTDLLRYYAGALVYSVGLPPPLAASAATALRIMLEEPQRVRQLQEKSAEFLRAAKAEGLDCGDSAGLAVIPIKIGDSLRAIIAADKLAQRGVHVIPVVFPGVPDKQARLRYFITVEHSSEDIAYAIQETAEVISDIAEVDLSKLI